MNSEQVLPLRKAAEENGATDFDAFRKAAKKFGALINVAGLEYVDRARFDDGVNNEVQAKVEQAARRTPPKDSSGRHLGLLQARINHAPDRIESKEVAITAAHKLVETAKNKYEKTRAKKAVAELEAGLKKLQANLEKDQAELDRILNEEEA
ncbi:hypothetical protein IT157_10980 [bacterium]|nr:hypothetical protein [bacterium]